MFYKVEIDNGEACIIGLTNKGLQYICEYDRMPEFPLEFDGLPVTRIRDYAFRARGIKKLPDSWGNITTIGQAAFLNNEIFGLPEDWGIVSEIGDSCFRNNNIGSISEWGIVQEIGEFAFAANRIEEISDWGDLRVISKGAFCTNNISELNASFRNIELIESSAFAENNILSEIGDMYIVPYVSSIVFTGNPGDEILFAKYREENERYLLASGV